MRLNAYILAADPGWIEARVLSYYDEVEGWTGVPIDVEQNLREQWVIDRVELHGLIGVSPLLPYPATGNTEATKLGVVFADFTFEQHDEALITAT